MRTILSSNKRVSPSDYRHHATLQNSVVLQEQIQELEVKKGSLVKELEAEGTPEQQRERLIEKIKKDNEEIANMQAQ